MVHLGVPGDLVVKHLMMRRLAQINRLTDLRRNQRRQCRHQLTAVARITPDRSVPAEMKPARASGYPHLLRRTMTVNDNPAAVGKLDFENTGADHRKIQIGATGFQSGLNPGQRCIGKRIEIAIVHPVLPFSICGHSTMRRQFTLSILVSSIALAACGTRGPLTLPPPPSKTPPAPADTSVTGKPVPVDLNTATEAAR